jgi:DNA adenine methylase
MLASYWSPKHKRYIEPFAGSACLFFALQPPRAILADINRELIITYTALREDSLGIAQKLERMANHPRSYYRVRKINPESLDPAARAARFIYLNRFCFNGLYRTNKTGQFNVPYGGIGSGTLPTRDVLAKCSKLLKRATLIPGDFEETLAQVRTGDFVYMDPPYSTKSKRVFKEYDSAIFGPEKILQLRQHMELLHSRGITFVISYAHSEESEFLARGFNCVSVAVRRSIAGFAGKRTLCDEVIISNA